MQPTREQTMMALMARGPGKPAPIAERAAEAVGDAAEDALALRAARGDREALRALLASHARDVATLCHHVVGEADARDAAQESLLRVVRELSRFDPERGRLRAWIMTLSRNVCRDRLRRRGLERGTFTHEGHEVSETTVSGLPDPERLAIVREDADGLARALRDLPGPMREAIVMFHVGDATYEEIAEALRVPIGTVMTWLHRGRKRLRAAVEAP